MGELRKISKVLLMNWLEKDVKAEDSIECIIFNNHYGMAVE